MSEPGRFGLIAACLTLRLEWQTDVPAAAADTRTVHTRYMSLIEVERDFRTMKTGLLELRPIFQRKAGRTEGHALVTMLALKLVRALDQRVAPVGPHRRGCSLPLERSATGRPRRTQTRL
ncbi:MAG TPA: hypothetical protein PLV87_11415, partial [Opitutaceae bacterium]|nr:hypothetical protein [Opitutaceae bacterium]